MKLSDAIAFLQYEKLSFDKPEIWADLGCGAGLFTNALANQLKTGSLIYAVDTKLSSFSIDPTLRNTGIKTIRADFTKDELNVEKLDGILMANSLHYVNDKITFLEKMIANMRPGSRFLIIEYDSDKPVPTWVPYPVSFKSLGNIFKKLNYHSVIKMHERPSIYHSGPIYSAIISR